MQFGIITLFPEMFEAIKNYGVTGRACEQGILNIQCWNPRDFTADAYHSVDDKPYGGGPGMVMKAAPLLAAIQAARVVLPEAKVIYLSPQGQLVTQKTVIACAKWASVIFVAGRYEGIDERVIDLVIDEEWSIGDYVLTGGELPAMIVMDAISRFVPGVLGDPMSVDAESFSGNLLDYPHYTRPEVICGMQVPDVLLSGNHKKIAAWRQAQRIERTKAKRPDLLDKQA